MIEWFSENYKWIFSGVGVTTVVLAYSLWRKWREETKPARFDPTGAENGSTDGKTSERSIEKEKNLGSTGFSVSPREIYRAVEDAPPLQRDNTAAGYKGIRVSWKLYFQSAIARDDGTVFLSFEDRAMRPPYVHCAVLLDDYPELKVLPPRTLVQISGKISQAESMGIELEDVALEIV